jgi:hypothetical protein
MEELDLYRQRLIERYLDVAADLRRTAASILRDDQERVKCEGDTLQETFNHLRDVETDYFQPLIRKLVGENAPVKGECRAQKWQAPAYSRDEPLEAILDGFVSLHRQGAEALQGLPTEAWGRVCRHPVWGDRTLQWWVEQSVAHSTGHLHQLQACFPGLVV